MTEKRFWILNTLTKCSGIKDKDKLLTFDEVVDLLNALNDENEQLKQLLDEAEDIIMCQCTPHYQRQWENIKKNLKGDGE